MFGAEQRDQRESALGTQQIDAAIALAIDTRLIGQQRNPFPLQQIQPLGQQHFNAGGDMLDGDFCYKSGISGISVQRQCNGKQCCEGVPIMHPHPIAKIE
jgi:hypothetical protein